MFARTSKSRFSGPATSSGPPAYSITPTYFIAGSKKSYSDVDWNAALAAAYAGIEDYKSRVELNSDYWAYANVNSSFTPDSLVVTLPPTPNRAEINLMG